MLEYHEAYEKKRELESSAPRGLKIERGEIVTGVQFHAERDEEGRETGRYDVVPAIGWKALKNGKKYGDFMILSDWPSGGQLTAIIQILQSNMDREIANA